jgi:hypothetical protein
MAAHGATHLTLVQIDPTAAIAPRADLAGPLLSGDVPDRSLVPWGSTDWTNHRNVTQMLEMLSARGEVAIAGRSGRQRLWPTGSDSASGEWVRRYLRSGTL